MDSIQPKKVAAVVAAVLRHATEVDAGAPEAASAPAGLLERSLPAASGRTSLWSLAGRRDGMLERTLCQRRVSRIW